MLERLAPRTRGRLTRDRDAVLLSVEQLRSALEDRSITDGGSALCHAAIVAREHGIPAVIATGNATKRLRDGQRVRVDGTGGSVSLIDD